MKTKFKLWIAIIFIATGIVILIENISIVLSIVLQLIGFGFILWFYHDFKNIRFEDMTEEELDKFLKDG